MLLLFFLLWVILNGRVTAEILLFGCLLSALVFLFVVKVFGWSIARETRLVRNVPVFLTYVLLLIREIVKSAAAVMVLAFSSRRHPDPVLVEFDSGFSADLCNVLLANAITLTPGTITVFQEKGHFVVHCLRPEYGEGLADSCFVRVLAKLRWD